MRRERGKDDCAMQLVRGRPQGQQAAAALADDPVAWRIGLATAAARGRTARSAPPLNILGGNKKPA